MVAEDAAKPIKLTVCILSAILSCFVMFEIIYCLKNLCCPNTTNTKNTKPTVTTSTLSLSLLTTSNSTAVGIVSYGLVTITISIYFILVICIEITPTEESLISSIVLITYIIGRWCMLLLFVLRIDVTFRSTMFEYPLIMIRILYIIVIFILILAVFIVIFGYLPIGIDAKLVLSIRVNGALIWVLLDFILSCCLMFLFLKKLFILFVREMEYAAAKEQTRISSYEMTRNMHDNEHSNGSSIGIYVQVTGNQEEMKENTVSNETTEKDYDQRTEMLIATTRYTLLVITAMISTLLAIAVSFMINYSFWMICVILEINAFINGLCLCLFNKFSCKIYNIICKYPHILCEHCCIDCIRCVHACSDDAQ